MGMAVEATEWVGGQGCSEWSFRLGQRSDYPFFVSPTPLQESLRLQEQAALETEDGEGLQQTLRDLAQV